MSNKRPPGYYWVKRKPYGRVKDPKWEIGRWDGRSWRVFSSFVRLVNEEERFQAIIERQMYSPNHNGDI